MSQLVTVLKRPFYGFVNFVVGFSYWDLLVAGARCPACLRLLLKALALLVSPSLFIRARNSTEIIRVMILRGQNPF